METTEGASLPHITGFFLATRTTDDLRLVSRPPWWTLERLAGISMQLGTVRKFFDTSSEKSLHHLDIAAKTLFACRENLRDCLWDLRSRALEEPDLGTAIRETLEPHVESTSLVIRFQIPRERLTDNAAHAILSIIRELFQKLGAATRAEAVAIALRKHLLKI